MGAWFLDYKQMFYAGRTLYCIDQLYYNTGCLHVFALHKNIGL